MRPGTVVSARMCRKRFSRRWGLVACLLAACAVLLTALAGCSSHGHYRDVVSFARGTGALESGVKTLPLRLVDPEDASPLAGIRVSILSRKYPFDLESDSDGIIQFPLLEDLVKENPRIVIHREGRTGLVSSRTGHVRIGNLQAEYVTLHDKEVIATEEFHIYYCKECEGEAAIARHHLERQYETIRDITGLAPVKWGVVIMREKDEAKNYFVPQQKGFPVWCYSMAQIHNGIFARVNAHEWTEYTLETNLHLREADVRNRFIHDGLSEYVAFRCSGLHEEAHEWALERLEKLRSKGVNVVNLLKQFRSLYFDVYQFGFLYFVRGELRPYWSYQEISRARGFPPGYPLSFVFWYNLCEEYGPGLPAEFLRRLSREEKPTADVAVRVLEEITGSRDIMDRLKRADVNAAIQVLQSLSRQEQQISFFIDAQPSVITTAFS